MFNKENPLGEGFDNQFNAMDLHRLLRTPDLTEKPAGNVFSDKWMVLKMGGSWCDLLLAMNGEAANLESVRIGWLLSANKATGDRKKAVEKVLNDLAVWRRQIRVLANKESAFVINLGLNDITSVIEQTPWAILN